jgi:hypothetical protein
MLFVTGGYLFFEVIDLVEGFLDVLEVVLHFDILEKGKSVVFGC